jgi:hypothetical protein
MRVPSSMFQVVPCPKQPCFPSSFQGNPLHPAMLIPPLLWLGGVQASDHQKWFSTQLNLFGCVHLFSLTRPCQHSTKWCEQHGYLPFQYFQYPHIILWHYLARACPTAFKPSWRPTDIIFSVYFLQVPLPYSGLCPALDSHPSKGRNK